MARALGTADLVITKGQANDDVFSAYRAQVAGQVFGLFTITCEAVARVWGAGVSSSVDASFVYVGTASPRRRGTVRQIGVVSVTDPKTRVGESRH